MYDNTDTSEKCHIYLVSVLTVYERFQQGTNKSAIKLKLDKDVSGLTVSTPELCILICICMSV